MAADENRVFMALGAIQSEIGTLRDEVADHKAISTDEHRKVHQIVDATSEAVRNLTRMVEEMRPHVDDYRLKAEKIDRAVDLTEDYKEQRAEDRGAEKFKKWLYGLWASVGALIIFLLGKAWDILSARPHIPVLIIVLVWATVAFAQAHRHPNGTYFGMTAKFYETWMKPDDPKSSCCSLMDCAPVSQVRQINGLWEALPEGSNVWLSIPAAKVELNRDSPDGRSHLCRIGSTVLCFIAGAGG